MKPSEKPFSWTETFYNCDKRSICQTGKGSSVRQEGFHSIWPISETLKVYHSTFFYNVLFPNLKNKMYMNRGSSFVDAGAICGLNESLLSPRNVTKARRVKILFSGLTESGQLKYT